MRPRCGLAGYFLLGDAGGGQCVDVSAVDLSEDMVIQE